MSPSEWESFIHKGKLVEEAFVKQHLQDVVWSTKQQDTQEHWDVEGRLPNMNGDRFKFEIKGMKKINRGDKDVQDKLAWVEGKNVLGKPGWIRGLADYVVFERFGSWLIVNRDELFKYTWKKLEDAGFPKGKKPYHIYDRSFFGKKDKMTLVPYDDIEKLNDITKLKRDDS